MADKGFVVITVRKEVPDRDQARLIYDLVKNKMTDHPEVKITGHFSNHFDLNEDPPS